MFSALLFCVLTTVLPGKNDRPDLAVALIDPALRKDAYAVIRHSNTIIDIQSPREYTKTVREEITLFDARNSNEMLVVGYDNYSKARINEIVIYDAQGGLIRKVRKDEIHDVSAYDGYSLYSDTRALVAQLLGGRYPYTITYEYQVNYSATRSYPKWNPQQYYMAIEEAAYTVSYPEGLQIRKLELNLPEPGSVTPGQGLVRLHWSLSGLKAVPEDVFMPYDTEILPEVLLAPEQFEVEDYTGSMADWKTFGKFIYDINAGRDQVTPAMTGKIDALIAGVSSEKEKIAVLYKYLQQNTRYVSVQLGIGGWQTYPAEYVETNKYGDCKALSYFMKGMLHEAGIEAYPVLAGWGNVPFFKDDFVTPSSFNHMMLYVPEVDLWLECTSSYNPVGYIHDGESDRDVLLVTPEGGVKAHTPSRAFDDALLMVNDTLALQNGSWSLKGKRTYLNAYQDKIRLLYFMKSSSEQEQWFRESFDQSIDVLRDLEFFVSNEKPEVSCTYSVDLRQYGSASGGRLFLQVNPLYKFVSPCAKHTRVHDIEMHTPEHEKQTLVVMIPGGYHVEAMPEAVHLSDPRFGTFDLVVSQKGQSLQLERELYIPRFKTGAESYDDMCAFFGSIESADRGMLALKREGP